MIGGLFMSIWMYAIAGLMADYGHAAPPGGVNGKAEAR